MFAPYKFAGLALVAGAFFSGCAYYNYNQQFFADCRARVPEVRAYVVEHLPSLSEADRQILTTVEPRLAQANWVAVKFIWPNVCMVDSGAPPDCKPFRVADLRPGK